MRYRKLGHSDLEVSEIGLGSWLTYGVSVDASQARACIRRAFELGVNFFDTANMYGRGRAESLLGELLQPYPRADFVLATKAYFPMSKHDRGLSREQIHKQLDASLKRLRTDHVDLFQCHRYDDDTPLEETMQALTEVVEAGKARAIGFSQWKPRQIKAASRLTDVARFTSSQPQYSMIHRRPEKRVFPTCEQLEISQIVYSPLAQGVLTGKYGPDQPPPPGSRAANADLGRTSRRFENTDLLRAVEKLKPMAAELSLSMSQLALAWVLRDPRVASAIIGATRPQQIEQNVGAVGVHLSQETLTEIDAILEPFVKR